MNNAELDKLLKSAPVPDRSAEFWEQFPKRVTAKIHWQSQRLAAAPEARRQAFPSAWAMAAAAACFVLALTLTLYRSQLRRDAAGEVARAEKYYREIEAMFPNQVQAIIFDDQGPRLALAEQANVPKSTPLYLKVCGPRGCQQFVTFSGQQIRVNGDTCDVLLDAAGNVLLVGRQFVWSNAGATRDAGTYRIKARLLDSSS